MCPLQPQQLYLWSCLPQGTLWYPPDCHHGDRDPCSDTPMLPRKEGMGEGKGAVERYPTCTNP